MSNYTKSTNFATKDNLTPGDPLKVVRGTEIDTEFNNIATAVATKTDNSAAAITGGTIDGATVGATTPATGSFTTLAASGTTTLAGALVGAVTQAAFNTVSTTLNLGGAATAVNLGAATGTATVNNTTLAAKAITASTTLAVTGTSTLTGAVTATAGVSGPITSSSVSITGGSITGITDLAVADGGTGASTAAGALNNLLPSQTGNSSKYLQTDGTNASWDAVSLSTADITGTLGAANGGTGVSNNAAMTVTGSGNFAYTRTLTGTTNVTFPTTGTLATLAGTETLTNKTLTSPTLTTPTLGVATGTSFQGIIGNVTPAAGNFTTLGASSTATLNTLASSGATLTGGTINGMTVGATTASTGAFTTLTTSSTVTHNGGTANGVTYLNGSKVLTSGSALTFDGTNLGVGTASPLSAGGYSTLRINGSTGGLLELTSGNTRVLQIQTDSTSSTTIQTIANGANPPLIFGTDSTERMRLTNTGLGIGTSSPAFPLAVNGLVHTQGSGAGISISRRDTGAQSWLWYSASGSLQAYDVSTSLTRLTLDSSGNLGLGVTPSAWASGNYAVQVGTGAGNVARFASSTTSLSLSSNGFVNSAGDFKYLNTSFAATNYSQAAGIHAWFNAPSGTAGNTIAFTQAMTLDASGNLGVGTTSPTSYGGGYRTIEAKGSTTTNGGVFRTSTSDASYIGAFYVNNVGTSLEASGANPILFLTNSTVRARIPAAGGVQAVTTISVGDATPSSSGAGITFPATQSASSDANTLDDYEEGTWTPVVTFGGGSTGLTLDTVSSVGRYTKVGRTVSITVRILFTNKGSSTGTAVISGLPFTSLGFASCAVFNNGGITYTGTTQFLVNSSATTFSCGQVTTAGVASNLTDTNFSNSSDLFLQTVYVF